MRGRGDSPITNHAHSLPHSGAQVRNYISSENNCKKLVVNVICCMELSSNYPQTAGKSKLLMVNCEGGMLLNILTPEDMKVGQGFLQHAIPCFVGVGV